MVWIYVDNKFDIIMVALTKLVLAIMLAVARRSLILADREIPEE